MAAEPVAEDLVDVVVYNGRLVLDEDTERPREEKKGRQPEADLRHVPRKAIRAREGRHLAAIVDVDEVDAFAELDVVVPVVVVLEEAGSLLDELPFRLNGRERKSLRHVDSRRWILLQIDELLRLIYDADGRVIESGCDAARVDPLVVRMRRRVGLSVAVACHVTGAPDVVIADDLPPNDGWGLSEGGNALVDGIDIGAAAKV